MSRIGKLPVAVPEKVNVKIDGATVTVKGPKGELAKEFAGIVEVTQQDDQIVVTRPDDTREAKSHQGLVRSIVANMVRGVTQGYTRVLQINGTGYRAEEKKGFVRFDLGYSHPIMFELPEGITAAVDAKKNPPEIAISGIDKALVGQTASKIRSLRKPEPYKGKGIKYIEEHIRRKVGKAGGK